MPLVVLHAAPLVASHQVGRQPAFAASQLPSLQRWWACRQAVQSCQAVFTTPSPSARAQARHVAAAAGSLDGPSSTNNVAGGPSSARQVQRALGVDYGRRIVGLAVSTLGLAPRPLEGVPGCTTAADIMPVAAAVLEVAVKEGCDAVVVGLPVTATGSLRRRDSDSQQGRRCRNFATNLAALAKPHRMRVFLADERGSTLEARQLLAVSGSRRSTFDKRKDSVAAAVILTTFFDDPALAVLVKHWMPHAAAGGVVRHTPQQGPGLTQHQPKQQHRQARHAGERVLSAEPAAVRDGLGTSAS